MVKLGTDRTLGALRQRIEPPGHWQLRNGANQAIHSLIHYEVIKLVCALTG
jgi:hypothetical protein